MDYETGMIIVTILLALSEIIPFIPWIPSGGIIQMALKGIATVVRKHCEKEEPPNEP